MSAIRAPSCMYPVLITFDIVNTITEFLFVVIISVWTKCHCFGPVAYLGFSDPRGGGRVITMASRNRSYELQEKYNRTLNFAFVWPKKFKVSSALKINFFLITQYIAICPKTFSNRVCRSQTLACRGYIQ